MKNPIRRLPDSELEVMQAVWDCSPPVSRSDIEKIVNKTHPMAVTTILTLLYRLVEREFLTVEKTGNSNFYTPAVQKPDYLAAQSKSLISKLCGGDMRIFATALCDSGISKEEIEQLRQLLERGEL